jgi:alpha-L-arabinofuranosidase
MKTVKSLSALGLLSLSVSFAADTATINIDATFAGPEINPRMYGIFLEEINTGVDGGLYAELIRNRGFEDAKAPEGFSLINGRWNNGRGYIIPYRFEVDKSLPYWSLVKQGDAKGSMTLDLSQPLNTANPRSCRLDIEELSSGRIGIANDGYWGIGLKKGEQYELSFWARSSEGFSGTLDATLETSEGNVLAKAVKLQGLGPKWKQFHATLAANDTGPGARLVLTASAKGTVWLDMISLFPKQTFKNRPNGLRPDIAQMIADLKPGFVRFPGGCVVEGATPENAYDWKKSIGPLEQREEIWNVWDYRRTHGMGMFEYLQFCEDLNAEPMYVGFAGQTCIYRHSTNVPMSQMESIKKDFVDAVEYANGAADSEWGKQRVAAGHPKPFNLKLLEIGNENVGATYEQRYSLIYPQVRAAATNLTILANFPQRQAPTEMVDEHYYNGPQWFLNNLQMYDGRDRKSPPVYIAEVAVTSAEGGRDKGNLISALSEGVFLMGTERNADVVRMVSYAPLLANVHGRTELAGAPPPWHGMIYFDSSRVFGTVSYHLWKLFAENVPSHTVKTEVVIPGAADFKIAGQIGVGTWNTSAEFKDVRVEREGKVIQASDFTQDAEGWQPVGGRRNNSSWLVENGSYRQPQPGRATSYSGKDDWSDYTLTLKARKTGGGEGFLVMFGRKGNETYWWNLGGWGNTRHALEQSVAGSQTPVGNSVEGRIETDRWYDLKVELAANRIRCYLDGKLIHDETAKPIAKLFALAGRDEEKNELVLKVINTAPNDTQVSISLKGVPGLQPEAKGSVLRSARLSDNNSLENPESVVPTPIQTPIAGNRFTYNFPSNSLTVLRLKTAP